MRVLVVDESPERAELLREGLKRAGHEVTATLSSPLALLKSAEQLKPDVIVMGFEEFQSLHEQLADANLKLTERKLVERAKGLMMKSRGLGEEEAYQLLRRFAMDRNLKLAEVAQQLIDAADLLGA